MHPPSAIRILNLLFNNRNKAIKNIKFAAILTYLCISAVDYRYLKENTAAKLTFSLKISPARVKHILQIVFHSFFRLRCYLRN